MGGIKVDAILWLSNEKRAPGCLGYIGDYTTQLCGDYNKPLTTSIMENKRGIFVAKIRIVWVGVIFHDPWRACRRQENPNCFFGIKPRMS